MAKRHHVQHKLTEKSDRREIAELKRIIQQQHRKISRLQKFLQKALETSGVTVEASPDTAPIPIGCPDCGSHNVVSVQLPHGILRGCKNCGWKKKQ